MKKRTRNTIINIIGTCMLILLAMVGLCFIGIKSLDAQGKVECLKWRNQADTMPGFYWTDWQIDQCRMLGVIKVTNCDYDKETPPECEIRLEESGEKMNVIYYPDEN